MKHAGWVVFILFFLFGCVSTKVASLIDPDYHNKGFKRVLVIGNFANIDVMKQFENNTVERLKQRGLYAAANYILLPPLREYSDDEKRQVFIKEQFDCYMIISGQGVNNATIYVPTISTTQASVEAQKNRISGTSASVTNEGGARNVVSSIDTQGELYDFQNGRIAWRGSANSKIPYYYGSAMAEPEAVFKSACMEIVDQLINDGILKGEE
ncbi:MAG: hypothetical protein ACKVRP_02725 [Bacteroidota bacterium]